MSGRRQLGRKQIKSRCVTTGDGFKRTTWRFSSYTVAKSTKKILNICFYWSLSLRNTHKANIRSVYVDLSRCAGSTSLHLQQCRNCLPHNTCLSVLICRFLITFTQIERVPTHATCALFGCGCIMCLKMCCGRISRGFFCTCKISKKG